MSVLHDAALKEKNMSWTCLPGSARALKLANTEE
jgi:hypothetical protein